MSTSMTPDAMDTHDRYMAVAIEEARIGASEGEQPFGAVVVLNGEIVVRTHSIKVATSDTTAHSETRAISLVTQKLKARLVEQGRERPGSSTASGGAQVVNGSTGSGAAAASDSVAPVRSGTYSSAHPPRPRKKGKKR